MGLDLELLSIFHFLKKLIVCALLFQREADHLVTFCVECDGNAFKLCRLEGGFIYRPQGDRVLTDGCGGVRK